MSTTTVTATLTNNCPAKKDGLEYWEVDVVINELKVAVKANADTIACFTEGCPMKTYAWDRSNVIGEAIKAAIKYAEDMEMEGFARP